MSEHTPTPLQTFLADPDVAVFTDEEPITVKIGYIDDFTLDIGDLRDVQKSHDTLVRALYCARGQLVTLGGDHRPYPDVGNSD
jgi:hypothetical protein